MELSIVSLKTETDLDLFVAASYSPSLRSTFAETADNLPLEHYEDQSIMQESGPEVAVNML